MCASSRAPARSFRRPNLCASRRPILIMGRSRAPNCTRAWTIGSRRCRRVTRPSRSLVRWRAMPREREREKEQAGQKGKSAGVMVQQRAGAQRRRSPVPISAQANTVAIVGAGRVGSALALALSARGYRISALVTNNIAHARRSARLFSTPRPHALAATQLASLPRTDLLIIATPDGQIAATATQLATLHTTHSDQARSPTRVALHTSGALSSDVLSALRAAGYAAGSLHPLVSVSDARAGATSLRGAFYCIEGDAAA